MTGDWQTGCSNCCSCHGGSEGLSLEDAGCWTTARRALARRKIECRQPASEARRHNKYVSSQAACVASTCSSLLLVSALLLSPTSLARPAQLSDAVTFEGTPQTLFGGIGLSSSSTKRFRFRRASLSRRLLNCSRVLCNADAAQSCQSSPAWPLSGRFHIAGASLVAD